MNNCIILDYCSGTVDLINIPESVDDAEAFIASRYDLDTINWMYNKNGIVINYE